MIKKKLDIKLFLLSELMATLPIIILLISILMLTKGKNIIAFINCVLSSMTIFLLNWKAIYHGLVRDKEKDNYKKLREVK